jgi:hypothetical protein
LAVATAAVVSLWRSDRSSRGTSAPLTASDLGQEADPQSSGFATHGSRAAAIAAPSHLTPPPSMDEATLMAAMRDAETTMPGIALELAREGERRFPDSADAAERAAAAVKCLARLGRVPEARGEAEIMVNRYAGTTWALEVERHTGAHPHTNR